MIRNFNADGFSNFNADGFSNFNADGFSNFNADGFSNFNADGFSNFNADGFSNFNADGFSNFNADGFSNFNADGFSNFNADGFSNFNADGFSSLYPKYKGGRRSSRWPTAGDQEARPVEAARAGSANPGLRRWVEPGSGGRSGSTVHQRRLRRPGQEERRGPVSVQKGRMLGQRRR